MEVTEAQIPRPAAVTGQVQHLDNGIRRWIRGYRKKLVRNTFDVIYSLQVLHLTSHRIELLFRKYRIILDVESHQQHWWKCVRELAWVIAAAIPQISNLTSFVGAACILQFSYTFPPMTQARAQ
jgi:hypothetical protein